MNRAVHVVLGASLALSGVLLLRTATAARADNDRDEQHERVPPGIPVKVPSGTLVPFAGQTAPPGFQLCDGHELSRIVYVKLFSVIGTTYGAGNGTTTFNVPDLRGRAGFGADAMGGSAAGRLSTMGALGAVGGAEQVTLTVDQAPAHSHSITDQSHSHGASFSPSGSVSVQLSMIDGTFLGLGAPDTGLLRAHGQNQNWESGNVRVNGGFGGSVSVNSSSTGITGTNETGGGQPVSVVPPAMAINYLIKD